MKTSYGDLEIELWCKECPKATRNFIQLCLEGYYTKTIFHRMLKDFLVQGGDPTGTGNGGESIYGEPFPDEINSRLLYRTRGCVGVANAGKGTNTNGSQFFITLAPAPGLNKEATMFGRVCGQTVYNLVRFNELEVDGDDRPLTPPMVTGVEVLMNPFTDIIPRNLGKGPTPEQELDPKKKEKVVAVKNKSRLAFDAESDEDDDEDEPRAPALRTTK